MTKYHDWSNDRPLSLSDGCSLSGWARPDREHVFSVHPAGFPVFLEPDRLLESDEYKDRDPHEVQQGLHQSFQRRRIEITMELIDSAMHEKDRKIQILDLGCGQGHITAEILKNFPSTQVSGLDYSLSAIEYAASHFTDPDFCVADAHNPPYSPGYFDIVICNNLWEHVPDPLRLLQGIKRIIRHRGYLILSTPSRYRIENLARILLGRPPRLMAPNHVTEYSVGQVKEQLEFSGFTIIKVHSRPKKEKLNNLRRLIGFGAMKPIVRGYLRIVGSHHCLESTVFFLSRNKSA